jgi:hypothetical protein
MRHSSGIMRFECYLPISSVIREATLRALAFQFGPRFSALSERTGITRSRACLKTRVSAPFEMRARLMDRAGLTLQKR